MKLPEIVPRLSSVACTRTGWLFDIRSNHLHVIIIEVTWFSVNVKLRAKLITREICSEGVLFIGLSEGIAGEVMKGYLALIEPVG